MKKRLLFVMALMFCAVTIAQETDEENGGENKKGKTRVGLNFGVAIPDGTTGIMSDLEINYFLVDNMSVGLLWKTADVSKYVTYIEGSTKKANKSWDNILLGTYDYYLKKGSGFAPFVGAGFGYAFLDDFIISADNKDVTLNADSSGKIAGLVRTGFVVKNFRFTLEYTIIPKTEFKDTEGKVFGSAVNSFFGISVGWQSGAKKFGGIW